MAPLPSSVAEAVAELRCRCMAPLPSPLPMAVADGRCRLPCMAPLPLVAPLPLAPSPLYGSVAPYELINDCNFCLTYIHLLLNDMVSHHKIKQRNCNLGFVEYVFIYCHSGFMKGNITL